MVGQSFFIDTIKRFLSHFNSSKVNLLTNVIFSESAAQKIQSEHTRVRNPPFLPPTHHSLPQHHVDHALAPPTHPVNSLTPTRVHALVPTPPLHLPAPVSTAVSAHCRRATAPAPKCFLQHCSNRF